MKIDQMTEWGDAEREQKEKEWRQALFNLRMQKAQGQLDNPMKIRELRRDIARLKMLGSMAARPEAKPAKGAKG
ncbi:MAG: 50S ribosomal protein L29 [Acidobacteria bacterium]|nr:50S ribosomal protein L29 [Acidobacteriota bacterium]MCG3192476.1 50S ribosomal protein L29 [Thermoanaerobaculia bacterium]MCK6683309.1 50S ribosomal protein L29 [Thermoanaerobaculia bacterium]